MSRFKYKSFAWNVCGTSFRRKDTISAIRELLVIIDDFWNLDDNKYLGWSKETQALFYDYAYNRGFISGDIKKSVSKKAEDVRELTSGIGAFGFLDNNKRVTRPGRALCDIDYNKRLYYNEEYQLPEDTFIFFCQMLKLSKKISGNIVRPYYVLGKLFHNCDGYLTKDEFTYLLPLCINERITNQIIKYILQNRHGNISIDEVICNIVLSNNSYPTALDWFISEDKTDSTICEIIMHYKGPNYATGYVQLYNELKNIYLNHDTTNLVALKNAIKNIGSKKYWNNYCFLNPRKRKITEEDLRKNGFNEIGSQEDFDRLFFRLVHLFKTKYMLEDYYDNNKRFFRATNTIIFDHDKIQFAPLYFLLFKTKDGDCFNEAYKQCELLNDLIKITDISNSFAIDKNELILTFNNEYNQKINDISEIYEYFDTERTNRFKKLIDEKFTNEVLIYWLEKFKDGSVGRDGDNKDNEGLKKAFGEATDEIPAIFEYIVGIIWYRTSGYTGRILDYIRTGMTADLYPTHHAPGTGVGADIVYEYEKTDFFIQHDLLIEMTTERTTGQRELEMESVSRHLAKYMCEKRMSSYCIFVATRLGTPLISDFRLRKFGKTYYDDNRGVDSMKIITMDCEDLINILRNGLSYAQIYKIVENAFLDKKYSDPLEWYKSCVKFPISEGTN